LEQTPRYSGPKRLKISDSSSGLNLAARIVDFIKKSERRHPGLVNARRAMKSINPINLSDLKRIVDLWADAALQLTDSDLKVMNRLTRAQERIGHAA